jgi:large subunit ribosomal protein L21
MKIAVIATGGKQYVVSEGTVLNVEKLDAEAGKSVSFDTLFVDDGSTADLKPSSKVTGAVVEAGRGKKVIVVRYKQKSRYHKKRGHRQPFTKVKIEKIN